MDYSDQDTSLAGSSLNAARQRLEGKGTTPFDVKKALAQNKAREEGAFEARAEAMEKLEKDIKLAKNAGDKERVRTLEAQHFSLRQQSSRQFSTMQHSIETQQGKLKGLSQKISQRPQRQ